MVRNLIEEYSDPGDVVLDCFVGSGTTLVEAMLASRRPLGTDINPLATFFTRVKTTPIDPGRLRHGFDLLSSHMDRRAPKPLDAYRDPRVQFWFTRNRATKLESLLAAIMRLRDPIGRAFFLCAFSHVLKDCSRWLQRSVKPTIDPGKRTPIPWERFQRHYELMAKGNTAFQDELKQRMASGRPVFPAKVFTSDARLMPIRSRSVDFVLTSPPYFISYDYMDILQLTSLWFGLVRQGPYPGRDKFMGSRLAKAQEDEWPGFEFALEIREAVCMESNALRKSVLQYLKDVSAWISELPRVIKPNGTCCIVVGNPVVRNRRIPLAEFYCEVMEHSRIGVDSIRKREVSNKSIPQTRDAIGRFAPSSSNSETVYPTEFVITGRVS